MEANVVELMTEREILLKKISTYQFAAHDLQLFIDTHPNDTETVTKMRAFKEKAQPLIAEYESKYGPLTKSATTQNNWNWIKAPWPWESEEID